MRWPSDIQFPLKLQVDHGRKDGYFRRPVRLQIERRSGAAARKLEDECLPRVEARMVGSELLKWSCRANRHRGLGRRERRLEEVEFLITQEISKP